MRPESREANAYAPPQTPVSDLHPDDGSSRPSGVWVILALEALALAARLANRLIVSTHPTGLPPAYLRAVTGQSLPEFMFTTLILLAWMIQFWRLKRSAPYIFTFLLVYGLTFHVILDWQAHRSLSTGPLIGWVAGWCLNLSICAYAWTLWGRRILK